MRTPSMCRMRFPQPLLALLALCAVASADDNEDTAVTTAPIYLPYYNQEAWSLVRGSVIASVGDPSSPPSLQLGAWR